MIKENQIALIGTHKKLWDFIIENHFLKNFIVVFIGILVTITFFSSQLRVRWELVFGDQFDGLIEFSILQHWYNVFHGIENWRTVGYFYPYQNTLGYNDGYFLYGILYTALRMLNIKMFMASELVNVIIQITGFYSFFYLCHRKLKLKFFVCLLTASIFSLGNAIYVQSNHVQLLSIFFAPVLTILIVNYYQQLFVFRNIVRSIFWGALLVFFILFGS